MRAARTLGQRFTPLLFVDTGLLLVVLVTLGCAPGADKSSAPTAVAWTSRTTPEARGEIREVAGKRMQVRYSEEPFSLMTGNFERWPTYAYTDTRKFPAPVASPGRPSRAIPKRGARSFCPEPSVPARAAI